MKTLRTSPAFLFSLSLLFGYIAIPLLAYGETDNAHYLDVALLAALSATIVLLFSKIRFSSSPIRIVKIVVDETRFLFWVYAVFFSLALYIVFSAPGIPLLAWFGGADIEALVLLREEFLKARTGGEAILPYLNSLFTGALIPYTLAYMFIRRHSWRWMIFGLFLVYCVIFIEKVYFLKAVVPLFFVMFLSSNVKSWKLFALIAVSGALVYGLGIVSGFGSGEATIEGDGYFSNTHRPSGAASYLLWRAISVPAYTAADSLSYFFGELRGEPLLGATTGVFSSLFGLERIWFERDVFAYQWGQTETGTGSSNAVYFIDAFVNFGVAGVVVTSALIGMIFRYIKFSDDLPLQAVWPLLAFGLYVSGFIGNLASGGFLIVLLFSVFFSLRASRNNIKGNSTPSKILKYSPPRDKPPGEQHVS